MQTNFITRLEKWVGIPAIILAILPLPFTGWGIQLLLGYILYAVGLSGPVLTSLDHTNIFVLIVFALIALLAFYVLLSQKRWKPDWLWVRIFLYLITGTMYFSMTFQYMLDFQLVSLFLTILTSSAALIAIIVLIQKMVVSFKK